MVGPAERAPPVRRASKVGPGVHRDPFCRKSNGCPAIVNTTERAAPPFGWTSSRTVPLPEPVRPSATVTHGTVLVALQLQALSAVTSTRMSSGPRPAPGTAGLWSGLPGTGPPRGRW